MPPSEIGLAPNVRHPEPARSTCDRAVSSELAATPSPPKGLPSTRSFRHASATSSPQRLRMTGLLVGYAANSRADCRDAAARRVSGPGPETTADRSYPDD